MSDSIKYSLRLVKYPDGRMEWRDDEPSELAPARGYLRRWRVGFLFAWYDLWVGAYWNAASRKLYILPLPCVGIVIEFPKADNGEMTGERKAHKNEQP